MIKRIREFETTIISPLRDELKILEAFLDEHTNKEFDDGKRR